MFVSIRHPVNDPGAALGFAESETESRKTVAVLEELLGQSIDLRDLYKNARWQTTDIQYRSLRQLFDRHYQEQLRLVDVLTDRVRTLGGGRQVFASQFLQGTRFACALRGARAAGRLLRELLDAHELMLNAVHPNGSATEYPWLRDFAVGQVVLTNHAQISSISDQLTQSDPRVHGVLRRQACTVLDCDE